MRISTKDRFLSAVVMVCSLAALAFGQVQSSAIRIRPPQPKPLPYIIVPQVIIERPDSVCLTEVNVEVTIRGQVAITDMVMSLRNDGRVRAEAQMLLPVPPQAVVRGFGFDGVNDEMTARVLPKEEARSIYREIVARLRDPALLEFVGYNLIRSSAFPIEPGKTQKVRLVYEHVLPADGDRFDYVLPRSESLRYDIPWHVQATITSKRRISTVYSPSHTVTVKRINERSVTVTLAGNAACSPGPFRLSTLLDKVDGVSASLFAYPDPKIGGGYFLLLAGLSGKHPEQPSVKREITMVIDRSGSMRGEKIAQAKEAALQVLAGLNDGERFNFISYNESASLFANAPVVKNQENTIAAQKYIADLTARGGTNIHDALLEALRQKPTPEMFPIILFLTDGLPTVGQTSERAICNVAENENPHHRRVFTFGVGVDVNAPLLAKVAATTRATSTFVLPKEDVEVKVGKVFRNLSGPIMAGAVLRAHDGKQEDTTPPRVSDMMPHKLPDLFEGDQLIVLGQYKGAAPLDFTLSGNYLGREKSFAFMFPLDQATTCNSFVPRLWAGRKIAFLETAIRELGADLGLAQTQLAVSSDPRVKELIQEIITLSTEFGILTEYTAFLADEKTNLAQRENVVRDATRRYEARAMRTRSGKGAVNQDMNLNFAKNQTSLNRSNAYINAELEHVTITNVQQINDRAFYFRNNRWIDSRLVSLERKPDHVLRFGSDAHLDLVERLAKENRQGCMALKGGILLQVDGDIFEIK